jgi:hypothetical protein
MARLFRALGIHYMGDKMRCRRYSSLINRVNDGLAAMCWNAEDKFFCDVLPNGTKTKARPATGIYPLSGLHAYYLWHNDGLRLEDTMTEWLDNPQRFNLPAGFPADCFEESSFSAEGEWKDKRLNCPWNGRSWPMVNSHLVDAAASFARTFEWELGRNDIWQPKIAEQKRIAANALIKSVRLMFHDGDPARPNSYEHYNPITGRPALYRGYDDYMHSWIVDLILRHAVGVQPGRDEIDPLPLGVDWIECTDIPHPKGRMRVRIEKDQVVRCDVDRET